MRARIDSSPKRGRKPSKRGCSSRTIDPPGSGCWPVRLPTGPEKLPVWTPDTRSGGS